MNDPTEVGPPPAPLTGGATQEQAHEATPPEPSWSHRALARVARAGAALSTPIMLDRAHAAYRTTTDEILRARQDPERVVGVRDVMASLDEFLEKKAYDEGKVNTLTKMPGGASWATHVLGHGAQGLAQGAGSAVAEALMAGIGKLMGGASRSLYSDPKKKALLQRAISSDQVLSEAVQRSPMMAQNMLEAYATMNKFAPTLTTDVNAVRSFLREVVLGGGHVNYATIKNLVETEKALHQDRPWYHGA